MANKTTQPTKKLKVGCLTTSSLLALIYEKGQKICHYGFYMDNTLPKNRWPSLSKTCEHTLQFYWQLKQVLLFFANNTYGIPTQRKDYITSNKLKITIEHATELKETGNYIANGIIVLVASILQLDFEIDGQNANFKYLELIQVPSKPYKNTAHLAYAKRYIAIMCCDVLWDNFVPGGVQNIIVNEYLNLEQDTLPQYQKYRSFALTLAEQLDFVPSCQKQCF